MTAQPLGVVVDPSAAGRRPVPLQVVGHLLPQRRRRRGQPEVHVAGGGERGQHRHVVGLQPGGTEHRQPGRQVDGLGSLPQRPDGRRHPLGRLRSVHSRAEPSPQLGLPGPVGTQGLPGRVDVAMLGPGVQHARPAGGVRGEQLGLVPGHRPAPTGAAVEVGPQQPGPRLVPGLVDDPQQRPDHLVGPPRVVLLGQGLGRRQRPRDQAPGRAEVDRRTDAVGPSGPGAQPRGQPLAQPPLHPGRRHADDLGGEGVRKRVAQQGRRARAPGGRRAPRGGSAGSWSALTLFLVLLSHPSRSRSSLRRRSSRNVHLLFGGSKGVAPLVRYACFAHHSSGRDPSAPGDARGAGLTVASPPDNWCADNYRVPGGRSWCRATPRMTRAIPTRSCTVGT